MKSDCNLDKSLEKQFLRAVGFPPYVFPDFVGVVEISGIEQANPVLKSVRIHRKILAGALVRRVWMPTMTLATRNETPSRGRVG